MSAKKEPVYQSTPVATLQLTVDQRERALELLALRPEVVPGTRAIINQAEGRRWFSLVITAMIDLKVSDAQAQAFCDLAGVPD